MRSQNSESSIQNNGRPSGNARACARQKKRRHVLKHAGENSLTRKDSEFWILNSGFRLLTSGLFDLGRTLEHHPHFQGVHLLNLLLRDAEPDQAITLDLLATFLIRRALNGTIITTKTAFSAHNTPSLSIPLTQCDDPCLGVTGAHHARKAAPSQHHSTYWNRSGGQLSMSTARLMTWSARVPYRNTRNSFTRST